MFSVCRICQASCTFVATKLVLPHKSYLPTAVAAERLIAVREAKKEHFRENVPSF